MEHSTFKSLCHLEVLFLRYIYLKIRERENFHRLVHSPEGAAAGEGPGLESQVPARFPLPTSMPHSLSPCHTHEAGQEFLMLQSCAVIATVSIWGK